MLFTLLLILGANAKFKHHQLAHQVAFQDDHDVILLNRDNFDAALMRYEVLLVMFYAPWCPHCQRMEPEFAEAATTLRKKEINLGKVDCTKESYLCSHFEVRGYPTLRIFYHDKIYHYYGHRDKASIVNFMVEHLKEQRQVDVEN